MAHSSAVNTELLLFIGIDCLILNLKINKAVIVAIPLILNVGVQMKVAVREIINMEQ